jgi:arylsulfatase A-like enzyme
VTLLTGLGIVAHRVSEVSHRLDPARRTLAQQFASAGYRTAAFVSAPLLHRDYGFDRGFEIYRNLGTAETMQSAIPTQQLHDRSHEDRTAARVVDAAREWLTVLADSPRPYFLFVHLWDPHYDYDPPPPYDELFDPDYGGTLDASDYEHNPDIRPGMARRDLEHVRALYDGEIRWTDANVGRLLRVLELRGTLDRTVVALVSDHGEEFFEHGRKGHMKALFEESVRVPWLLRYPPRVRAGSAVATLASLEDVGPTLLDLADLDALPEATGLSRRPDLEGGASEERPALLVLGHFTAVRGRDWKLRRLSRGPAEYFDLASDPGELRPLLGAAIPQQALAALDAALERERAHAAALHWDGTGPVQLDARTLERLRELGYLVDPGEPVEAR